MLKIHSFQKTPPHSHSGEPGRAKEIPPLTFSILENAVVRIVHFLIPVGKHGQKIVQDLAMENVVEGSAVRNLDDLLKVTGFSLDSTAGYRYPLCQ